LGATSLGLIFWNTPAYAGRMRSAHRRVQRRAWGACILRYVRADRTTTSSPTHPCSLTTVRTQPPATSPTPTRGFLGSCVWMTRPEVGPAPTGVPAPHSTSSKSRRPSPDSRLRQTASPGICGRKQPARYPGHGPRRISMEPRSCEARPHTVSAHRCGRSARRVAHGRATCCGHLAHRCATCERGIAKAGAASET